MILPILGLFWMVFGGSAVVASAAKGLVVGTAVMNHFLANRSLMHFYLGVNPIEQKILFAEEMENERIAPGSGDLSSLAYRKRFIDVSKLPPGYEKFAGEWRLNDSELIHLEKMIQQCQIQEQHGKAWEQTKGILEALANDPVKQEELMHLLYQGPTAFFMLHFWSENRKASPDFIAQCESLIGMAS